jgi:membrane associated rhomboid family serine protease
MRPAPVGFQCPDDVAAGQRPVRATVNPLGGPAAQSRPVVTWTLVALNAIAFVLEGFPLLGLSDFPNAFVGRFIQDNRLVDAEPYRLLTAAFLHESIWHIGFNMLALVLIGMQLEQVLGRARYLGLFFVSALGGGVFVYVFNAPDQRVLGASGAIFGMFGAFYLVAKSLRVDASSILVTIGINLVLTVVIPNVSIFDHLGGLVTGAVIGLIYTRLPGRTTGWKLAQIGAVLVVALLLGLTAVVRSAALT